MISEFVDEIRRKNGLVAGGMFFFDSPGHMLSESDYLLRKIKIDPQLKRRHVTVILPLAKFSKVVGEILNNSGFHVVWHENAKILLREIQLFHPDLIIDVGQASWKLVLHNDSPHKIGNLDRHALAWGLNADEFINQYINLLKAWSQTENWYPLKIGLEKQKPERSFLSRFNNTRFLSLLKKNKYAVLQIKNKTGNGTLRLFDGEVYKQALGYLRDNGYTIILGGREPMLDEFRAFGVIDYPRSLFASPRNDFHLFANADVALVSPSGAAFFADVLSIKSCQIGNWTLMPQPSSQTVHVPCRLRNIKSGELLTFAQQASAFVAGYDPLIGPAAFDRNSYEPVLPTAEEILKGLDEAVKISAAPISLYQNRIQDIDPVGLWACARSRFSTFFIENNMDFLAESCPV